MNLLLDTNIFLEVMLDQTHAGDARRLLASGNQHQLWLSDFSLHSIGCHLFRRGKAAEFGEFVRDVLVVGGLGMASLRDHQYTAVTDAATRFRLDFDDAYQYAIALTHDLQIVSFDADFDRTDLGRLTPPDLLPRIG